MRRFAGALVVLSDSTAPVAFCQVGAGAQLVDYLDPRLMVTRDVWVELRRKQRQCLNLHTVIEWLESAETERIHDLTPQHIQKVMDILPLLGGEHPRENIGEVSTVFAAEELRAAGREPLLCMDDQLGKKLAHEKRLAYADTPALLVEMVCAGELEPGLADRIWRQGLFPNARGRWRGLRERIRSECPDRDL